MKHFYAIFFLLFTIVSTQAQIQGYGLNDVVDDFTVTDIHGEEHNLYTYTSEGKYVFIDFSFTTCGPCQSTAPIFNEFYDKYGCNSGDVVCISFFGINNDHDSDVEAFENTYGGSFNHAPAVSMDGGATSVDSNFNPAAYPTVCLINPNNEIIELDIWPISNIAALEATFPTGFEPEIIDCNSIGTNDFEQEALFSVYPNPFDGKQLTISLNNLKNVNLSIHTILGALVYTQILTDTSTINPNLNTGTYFVTLQTDTKKITQKLIVN